MTEPSAGGATARNRGPTALEWQIAWRHLRADGVPVWVRRVTMAAIYLLVLGAGLWLYLTLALGPDATVPPGEPLPGMDPVLDAQASRLQQAFGLCAALSLGLGTVLLLFSLLARLFSVLATIVMFEVVLGSMAMVVVLSLMSGLEGDLRDKILSQRSHIRVSRVDGNRLDAYRELTAAISDTEGVAGASPFLDGEVMVRSGLNRNPAVLYGVVPERMHEVSGLPAMMIHGSFDALSHPEEIPQFDPYTYEPVPEPVMQIEPVDDAPEDPDDAEAPIFAPTELPGVDDEPAAERKVDPSDSDDGGWEDPVEVLDLDGEPPAGDAPRDRATGDGADGADAPSPVPVFAPPPRGPSGLDASLDDDGGWEDPVQVLGLPPAAAPTEGEGEGEGEGGPPTNPSDPGAANEAVVDPILIGAELADELAVHVGARTQLITPVGRMTPAGRIPGVLATRVGGIFSTGMYEYDSKSVYAPLPLVQKFLRTGDRVSGIEVKLLDEDDVVAGKRRIEATVAGLDRDDELVVETWMDLNRNLFSAMFLEKLAMFIALSVVVFVASFGILASNLMSVLEKSSEIAVLKAMGSSDRLIQRVYWAEGLCVGIVGASAGIGLGLAICWALQNVGMPALESGLPIQELPVTVSPLEVLAVGVVVMLIVWAFSLYPAFVASRMRPVDALRHAD